MTKMKFGMVVLALALLTAQPCQAEENEGIGLNVDVQVASAYVFRGLNVFQETKQMDQNMLLAPSITYSIPGTSLEIGYWGAYQLNGANKSAMVDVGLGAEQDFWVGYSYSLTPDLSLSALFTTYYYPLADEKVAGTSNPIYIEPAIGLSWSGFVNVGFNIAYMYGVQDEVKAGRYLFLNPTLSKGWSLTEAIGLECTLDMGYKLFNEDIDDNKWHAGLLVGVPISLPYNMYVTPGAGVVWTNLTGKDFADELAAFGSVNVGVSL